MDYNRLAEINKRNARQARMLGNRKMANAYEQLARFHEVKLKETKAATETTPTKLHVVK